MNRAESAIATLVLGVAMCLGVVGSNDASPARAAPSLEFTRLTAVLDQQIVQLDLTPGVGQPGIPESRAIELAESQQPSLAASPLIQSRYVQLTLRTSDGTVARGTSSRMAWLITFTGVAYAPSGTSASVCNCAAAYARPNTVAALDAQTGALIAVMGIAG